MGASLPALRFAYEHQSLEDLLSQPTVLAVIGFGDAAPQQHADLRYIHVGLEPLTSPAPLEVWYSSCPVRTGQEGELRYSTDGDHLCGMIEVSEAQHGGIEAAAAHAYRLLSDFSRQQDCDAVQRIWNYMDGINEGEGDEERYRQFCTGRTLGMQGRFRGDYPAATAIGRRDGQRRLLIYWLAARHAGRPLENPRQVSAYHYPRQYGPTAPVFARAMLTPTRQLLVSGTAAVTGHASQHPGDPVAQLHETGRNVASLLEAAGLPGPTDGLLKLYMRDPASLQEIAPHLSACLPPGPLLALAGDVCRRELLLEVDYSGQGTNRRDRRAS